MMLCRDVDGLWSAFLSYLEAAPGDDEQELAALEKQLREVKQELADKRYLRGENNISAADLALVPPLTPCTIFAKHVPASEWQDYSQQASIRLPLVLPLTAWTLMLRLTAGSCLALSTHALRPCMQMVPPLALCPFLMSLQACGKTCFS